MSDLASEAVQGGFSHPVSDAQSVFRAVMNAFAEPGRIVDFGMRVEAPAALEPAAAIFLAALADTDTPIWLADADGIDTAFAWLAFQTGAPRAARAADAVYAVLQPSFGVDELRGFSYGTPDYPDRSATVILPVESLETGDEFMLEGPGIERETRIALEGLGEGFVEFLTENRTRFPQGLDFLVVCGTRAFALPRTTRVREA